MVPADGTHQLDQQVFVVNTLKETAVYVERMPGGVRGGGREAPLYSIGLRSNVSNANNAVVLLGFNAAVAPSFRFRLLMPTPNPFVPGF